MKTHSETVSFRAEQDLLKRIDKERSAFDLSRGAWVRGIITAHVFRDEESSSSQIPDEVQQAIEETRSQLEGLRMLIAKATLIVLNKVGDVPLEEARELVRNKLIQKSESA